MEAIILVIVFSSIGALTSIAGIIWSWVRTAARKSSMQLSIRFPGGTELSIRTDNATPAEIEDFIIAVVENKDRLGEGTEPTSSE
jgi:hypothetical protein